MDSTAPVIALENVHKIYDTGDISVHAVRDLSLSIAPGEFVAIMGASGSGKSTLMNMLGCLDRPTQGRYLLDGTDVADLSRDELADLRNNKLGFVFQSFNLLARTTALENVELPMLCRRPHASAKQIRARAEECLAHVGLSDRASHLPTQLSGGQQQRVAIARALVNKPEVILADEPTGNLDSGTATEIMSLFQGLNDAGITIIMVTHEFDIAQYCKRTLVMRDGEVVGDEPVRQRLSAGVEGQRLRDRHEAARLLGTAES
jgi:putative ABC transport system ATP-binding protein